MAKRKPADGVKKRPEKIFPWTTLSATDIRARIDLSLAKRRDKDDYVSVESVLRDVVSSPELREVAEEALDSYSPEEILCPFLEEDPKWVVQCTSSGMAGSVWWLKLFIIGKRGYLYFKPDEGPEETLPIVGVWEPVDDEEAFDKCFVDVYTAIWEMGFPPYSCQAEGPFDLMLDAVCRILRNDGSDNWVDVMEEVSVLRDDYQRAENVVKQVAGCTGISPSMCFSDSQGCCGYA
jgi:hypothetical protein